VNWLGIRPENFNLSDSGDGIGIDVAVVEELGADAYLYGTLAGLPEDELVMTLDGAALDDSVLRLIDDGARHDVLLTPERAQPAGLP